jgi:hypothetical protein
MNSSNIRTAFQLLVLGVSTGVVFEGVNFIRKEERYKAIFRFSLDHPGLAFAAGTAIGIASWLFGTVAVATLQAANISLKRISHK